MSIALNIHLEYDNFSLISEEEIPLKGITGILGHSGSGKTSLLRVIAGLNSNAIGTVEYGDIILQNTDRNTFIKSELRNIGFVFQDARLFPHLDVLGNLDFAVKRCQSSSMTIDEVICLTQIEHLKKRHVGQLSAGEKQRVALARAILAEPKLLLLDEPLSALDNKARGEMVELLRNIHQRLDLPMIYVSHSVIEIQQLADNVLVMENGKVIQRGHVHQVINQLHESVTHGQTIQTSLSLKIQQHLPNFGLTQLDFIDAQPGNSRLYTNVVDKKINSHLRCYILATDISITLQQPQDTSVINNLQGVINNIQRLSRNSAQITVNACAQDFLVKLTRYSVEKLKLEIGQTVYIQFKANAIRSY
ncbi:molybdenum ABC transporter ATP-binding protein [Thalassotalea psychrophila]|uniref:Molybdenum ABC transporter ATP-binding protein n=1 Tax=Thalassotalea psychrophila TaxID=3065647 RepID=A0ABY9TRS4_9GAMM|nr:molybdenum ABC transporter ATP-binding protein [Colwelliaceae bacterium SQ149]